MRVLTEEKIMREIGFTVPHVRYLREHFTVKSVYPEDQRKIYGNVWECLIKLSDVGLIQPTGLFNKESYSKFWKNPSLENAAWNAHINVQVPRMKQILELLDTPPQELAEHHPKESIWVTPFYEKPYDRIAPGIFVLMPIKDEFDAVLKSIKKVAGNVKMDCKRADELENYEEIMRDAIWPAIASSKFIIADLTELNPNVLYELGIADTVGKPAILIAKNTQNLDELPFDVQARRVKKYDLDNMADFELKLEEALKKYKAALPIVED